MDSLKAFYMKIRGISSDCGMMVDLDVFTKSYAVLGRRLSVQMRGEGDYTKE